jgi:uncharacterized membrane protein
VRPLPRAAVAAVGGPARVLAMDRLRGLVMVLMAVDHASGVFNAGRVVTDGPTLWRPGTTLPAGQFLTRWVTHLCAPTFVFLAGAALALSVARRRARGDDERALDRFMVARGLFIAVLDPLWMSWVFIPGHVLLQVLYAIGASLVAMAALRRLPDRVLFVAAIVLLVCEEAIAGAGLALAGGTPGVALALLVTGGQLGSVIVAYPLLPWLAMMMLGWTFGRFMLRTPRDRIAPVLVVAAAVALVAFVGVRSTGVYGDMRLSREDGSLVQWLHVSKYPPSLAYATLELGLMALALAALTASAPHEDAAGPLAVLGQTALFFYLLHVHVLAGVGALTGTAGRGDVLGAWLGGLAVVVALWPLCRRYRRYKRAHPDGWARFV